MPPNQSRSTSACRIALDQGGGLDRLGLDAEHRAHLGATSGIDFWLRGKTPPPFEISALS